MRGDRDCPRQLTDLTGSLQGLGFRGLGVKVNAVFLKGLLRRLRSKGLRV